MNPTKKYIVHIIPFIFVAMAVSLSGCGSSPTSQNSDQSTSAPTINTNRAKPETLKQLQPKAEIPKTESSIKESLSQNKAASSSNKSVNVTLFTIDSQCQELVPQKVSVTAEEPMESAVGKIIQQHDSADFNLSGYRVSVKDGVATVDLRLSPNSQRQFTSLSSCEQFALFGSLRKTLMSNSQWKVKDVRFTERGEEIVL